jgi:hypothetical protein
MKQTAHESQNPLGTLQETHSDLMSHNVYFATCISVIQVQKYTSILQGTYPVFIHDDYIHAQCVNMHAYINHLTLLAS